MAEMFKLSVSGSFEKTIKFLRKAQSGDFMKNLDAYGTQGVEALRAATPVRSGRTAESWRYRIANTGDSVEIEWYNTNIQNGTPIAVIIQYGHGTGTGGYVQGRDYINPALRPIFDKIAEDVWRQVKE